MSPGSDACCKDPLLKLVDDGDVDEFIGSFTDYPVKRKLFFVIMLGSSDPFVKAHDSFLNPAVVEEKNLIDF